jgi:hypothetical protein
MNGDRTIMVEILNAIEHGTLSVHETRRRLEDLIDKEIQKTDIPANVLLIEECEKLLWELNTNGKVQYTNSSEENMSAVLKGYKRIQYLQSMRKYAVRISAIAAALFILIVGGEALLHRTWISIFSTDDEQQFVIQGNEYDPQLVDEASAGSDITQSILNTTDYAEVVSFLNQDLNLATSFLDGWKINQYFCSVDISFNTLTVFYHNDTAPEQILLMNVLLYDSIEEATVVFEQSYHGKYMNIANQSVYVTENIDKIVITWQENNSIYTLSGNISFEDAQKYINTYYGENSYE